MKRITISTEDLNSYGFWVRTDGIDLSGFDRNPIMLYNHNRSWRGTKDEMLPIGRWKDLRVEGGVLTGEPVFDEADDFARAIMAKYESGVLNACSIGIIALETSTAPEMLKAGQTAATVTRCRLLEVSICDIPANMNATVLYGDNENIITLSEAPCMALSGKKQDRMDNIREITTALGLPDTAGPQACLLAIGERDKTIHAQAAELEAANKRLKAMEAAEAKSRDDEAERLLSEAVQSGRMDARVKEDYRELFRLDFGRAKSVLESMPARTPLAGSAHDGGDGICGMGWDELDKADRLAELKERHPEVYEKKFNEKFKKL